MSKLIITLFVLLSSLTAFSGTPLETEIVDLAKVDFPHWGLCRASTVETKALMVITLDCENKTATTTFIKNI